MIDATRQGVDHPHGSHGFGLASQGFGQGLGIELRPGSVELQAPGEQVVESRERRES